MWKSIPGLINPILIQIGPLSIRWYSLMYVTGLMVVYYSFIIHNKREQRGYEKVMTSFLNYSLIGIIIGARLGYVLFYNFAYYKQHLLEIFLPFQDGRFVGISGLSYHGGAIGFLLAMILLSQSYKINIFDFLNFINRFVPLGYTFGRIGNFLNLELYGRKTNSILGMRFPSDPEFALRYPSQLLEAIGEGLLIYVILLLVHRINSNIITPMYLILYGVIRFFIEFFREPDHFQVLWLDYFSYGQVLSIVMILLGLISIPIFLKYAKFKR